ncbi:flagellar basal body rod protein FlgC [Candidatus Megaera venefica]|jgi:flagellar basal-body rod protein FlgC|nr:flagellar basal body rod protein FlgC [Candidatus Megaera venefica]
MKRYFLLIVVFMVAVSGAIQTFADNLKQAVEIAAHGSKFQAERLKIAAENLANQDSTGATPGADAYRRKVIFPENKYDKKLRTNVIRTKKVDVDNSEFIVKYDPYHPAANEEGLVKYPNVTREIERADASEAQRSYEANLSVIEVSNSLMQKTVEAIGR